MLKMHYSMVIKIEIFFKTTTKVKNTIFKNNVNFNHHNNLCKFK